MISPAESDLGGRIEFDTGLATRIATRFAYSYGRQWGQSSDEIADLLQELLLAAISRWPRFDPLRAGPSTFLSHVIANAAINMSRRNSAVKRGAGLRRALLFTEVPNQHETHKRDFDAVELRNDVAAVVGVLPAELRELCCRLSVEPLTVVARQLGITRSVARQHVSKIRQRFRAAGLDPASDQ